MPEVNISSAIYQSHDLVFLQRCDREMGEGRAAESRGRKVNLPGRRNGLS